MLTYNDQFMTAKMDEIYKRRINLLFNLMKMNSFVYSFSRGDKIQSNSYYKSLHDTFT